MKDKVLVSDENLGPLPPTGSTKLKSSHHDTDLNEGMGEAWAGQIKVTEPSLDLIKDKDLYSEENFGPEPPIDATE